LEAVAQLVLLVMKQTETAFALNYNEISIASKERGEKRKEKDLTAGTLFETPN